MRAIIIGAAALAELALLMSAPSDAQKRDCGNGTQGELTQCFGSQAVNADKRLNRDYDTLAKRLEPKERKLLVSAQRAWITYRDSHCAFIGSATEGGSAQPMIIDICVRELTDQRDKELRDQLTCQEGDLSCVEPQH